MGKKEKRKPSNDDFFVFFFDDKENECMWRKIKEITKWSKRKKREMEKREETKKNFYTASIRDLIVDIHIALVICVDESFFRINVNTCGYEMLEMHKTRRRRLFSEFLKYFYEWMRMLVYGLVF